MNKRLSIIFLLGFSSGLPFALITSTLQAWFAATGMSVLATGMLTLIGLPYVYRICWGPLLDRYRFFSLGKRRSWMLLMQLALLIGFNILAWLNPQQSPRLMAFVAVFIACFSATQDIAIDAQRAEYLPQNEHGLGASLAVLGYRLALLIAGGLALIFADSLGWNNTYRLMGFLMLVGVFATLWSEEPVIHQAPPLNFLKAFIAPIKDLWTRADIIPLILFIIFYKLGEVFTATTSGIVMPFLIQGLGFSLVTVGYINKILGLSAILFGGLIAGLLLMRWTLYRALLIFGLLQALTNLLFVALAITGKNITLLAIAVFSDNFAAGMGSTAFVALLMRLVNKQFTATQFSLLVAIASLPRILSGPVAAMLQMAVGWIGLYQFAFIVALGFLPFLAMIRHQTDDYSELSSKKTQVIKSIC